jgi:hypothetical protein
MTITFPWGSLLRGVLGHDEAALSGVASLLAPGAHATALFFVWLFSNTLSHAFGSWIVPLIGFFILPWTTLAYAVMWDVGTREVTGFEWFVVGLAFLCDLGSYFGGNKARG